MAAENNPLRGIRRNTLIIIITSLVLGLLLLFWPGVMVNVICYIIGAALIVLGVMQMIAYFRGPMGTVVLHNALAVGLVLLTIGIITLFSPRFLATVIPVALGILILIDAAFKVQKSIDLLRLGERNWWMMLVVALVVIVLGVLVLCKPFAAMKAFFLFIGVALIVNAIADLITVLVLSHSYKQNIDG